MKIAALSLILLSSPTLAETVMPTRTIRPATVITADILTISEKTLPGTYQSFVDVVGLEARVALYPGRPIRFGDLVAPAIVERNDTVSLLFSKDGLTIMTEGRSLARAAVGETIRVMNSASHQPVFGTVLSDGSVLVSK